MTEFMRPQPERAEGRLADTDFRPSSDIEGFSAQTGGRFLDRLSPRALERARQWVNGGDPHIHVAEKDGHIQRVLIPSDHWEGSEMASVAQRFTGRAFDATTLRQLLDAMIAALETSLLAPQEQRAERARAACDGTIFRPSSDIDGFSARTSGQFLDRLSARALERARQWVNGGDPHIHVAEENGRISRVLIPSDHWEGSAMEAVAQRFVGRAFDAATLRQLSDAMLAAFETSLLTPQEQRAERARAACAGTNFRPSSDVDGFSARTSGQFLDRLSARALERARQWVNGGDPHIHVAEENGRISRVLIPSDHWEGSEMETLADAFVSKPFTADQLRDLEDAFLRAFERSAR